MNLDRLTALASLALVAGAAACSKKESPPPPSQPEPASETATPAATEAPAPSAGVQPERDTFETERGPLTLQPIHHGTLAMTFNGKTIVVDPTEDAPEGSLPEADLLLLTDIHPDHLDPEAIAAVRTPSTVVVAPAAVAETVEGAQVLANGQETSALGIGIRAVPMYNLERGPEPGKLYHDKGRGNGYLLDFAGTRVYLSGDTECTPEMKALEDVDVALVSMNLPYTMPPEEAATCVAAFRPDVVIPYHYRGSDLSVFEDKLRGVEGVELRVRDFYPGAAE